MAGLYYIAPLLVEQPTWGGAYIAKFKNLTDTQLRHAKIGQAFELAKDSLLTSARATAPTYGVASAEDIIHPQWYNLDDTAITLQALIDTDPAGTLGSRALEQLGPNMNILIKFTQAKNNSYQVHVKPGGEFGQWLAKPESWYYLEPGQATLGLAPGVDVAAYQARCQVIEAFAQSISQKIMAGELTLDEGKQQLTVFIDTDHPRKFVNTVSVKADQVIDLSAGGVHHSWEVNPQLPEGNIVYEVQVDVRDQYCTLRSFDQGSIKDTGLIRPLTIPDYFSALDTTVEKNQPSQYISALDPSLKEQFLFKNIHYQTIQARFSGQYQGSLTTLGDSFQHLFVQAGSVMIRHEEHEYQLDQGWSLFIPAQAQQYQLHAITPATVLFTTA